MTEKGEIPNTNESETGSERRGFLQFTSMGLMFGALCAAYGTFAAYAGRFLYPRKQSPVWQFVATLADLKVGESLPYEMPTGAKVVVARQGDGETADDFIALSSICPHLGCAVHWEGVNERFFCPCHNGAFDRQGNPTEGPPLAGNQQLTRFNLKVEKGLLYIEVSSDAIVVDQGEV